ncbi:IclR family transcriptional regulator [Dactylosporangium sucinum]|uniref:IclR family transcriptional regulator n=1 Tax=Dactylosporangium sucinum TaxID=1424081 RepID=A0A917WWN5_9ACTN|nr:IclR family transcriptional regulator [Dactylosporangium sucinum]GGM35734.1 IclR family transcriptional regulator [Dactylosporangium sucinum]
MCPVHRNDGEISSIGRAAALLKELRTSGSALGVASLARRCDLPKSTVHRLLNEMTRVGLVERSTLGYTPGLLLFELGQLVPRTRSLRDAARPHMLNLHDATGHNVALAVLEGAEVVYVDLFRSNHARRFPQRLGGRWPAHASCSGKAILAFSDTDVASTVGGGPLRRLTERTISDPSVLTAELTRIRCAGVAYDRQESIHGVVGVAAPILDGAGGALGAIAMSGFVGRINLSRVDAAVRTGALAISREMLRG